MLQGDGRGASPGRTPDIAFSTEDFEGVIPHDDSSKKVVVLTLETKILHSLFNFFLEG